VAEIRAPRNSHGSPQQDSTPAANGDDGQPGSGHGERRSKAICASRGLWPRWDEANAAVGIASTVSFSGREDGEDRMRAMPTESRTTCSISRADLCTPEGGEKEITWTLGASPPRPGRPFEQEIDAMNAALRTLKSFVCRLHALQRRSPPGPHGEAGGRSG